MGGKPAKSHTRLAPIFSKYLIVGLIGTAIHFIITVVLIELVLMGPVPASVIGFTLTVVVSFFLNNYWTFNAQSWGLSKLLKYFIVSVSGLLLNALIMFLATDVYSYHYLIGLLLVIIVIPPYNFTLNLLWSFR